MNHFDIAREEFLRKLAASSKINQIKLVFVCIVEVVGRIGVRLHEHPFKELAEAKLKHE